MKQILIATSLLLLALTTNAQASEGCAYVLLADTAPQIEQAPCVAANVDFKKSAEWLCSEDSVSLPYQAYVGYQTKIDAFYEELQNSNALTPTPVQISELRTIERDWKIYGYKLEIESSLSFVAKALRTCSGF